MEAATLIKLDLEARFEGARDNKRFTTTLADDRPNLSNVAQHLGDTPNLGRGLEIVMLFRNLLSNDQCVLSHRPEAVRQFLPSVVRHGCTPPIESDW